MNSYFRDRKVVYMRRLIFFPRMNISPSLGIGMSVSKRESEQGANFEKCTLGAEGVNQISIPRNELHHISRDRGSIFAILEVL